MAERILKDEMIYTYGLKTVMDILEQFRRYHYLEDTKRLLVSESTEGKCKIICDLMDATIETDDVKVVLVEIAVRKRETVNRLKKGIADLLILPSDIQKEFLHKDYYYNQEMIEDIISHLQEFIQAESPYESFDKMVTYMYNYGNQT